MKIKNFNVSTFKMVAGIGATIAVVTLSAACSDDSSSGSAASSTSAGAGGASGVAASGGASSGASPAGAPLDTAIVPSTSIASPSGSEVSITDPAILAAYAGRGYDKGYLGKPLGPVVGLRDGGKFITFEHGSLYLNPFSGKAFAVHGEIGDEWGSRGHETGPLGYPTGDETRIDGGLQQTFDGGTLDFVGGKVTEK